MNVEEKLRKIEQRFPRREDRQGVEFQVALGKLFPEQLAPEQRAELRARTAEHCPPEDPEDIDPFFDDRRRE